MNLAFLTKILGRCVNQAQVLLKRSCVLGKLVNTQTKGITLLCIGKNNVCISSVFNGFKYLWESRPLVRTKKIIFIFLNQNICCGYSKELSRRGFF